jgi:hypothetical protein
MDVTVTRSNPRHSLTSNLIWLEMGLSDDH